MLYQCTLSKLYFLTSFSYNALWYGGDIYINVNTRSTSLVGFLYDLDKNIMWISNANYLILAVGLLMKLVIKHRFVLILIHWIGKLNYFLYINEWLLLKRTIHSRQCICLYIHTNFDVKQFALLFCVFQNKANVGEMPVCVD